MEHTPGSAEPEDHLARLERQVAELIALCQRLREENRSLRAQQDHLVGERARLIEHNELARTRVEAMVSRLKAMEHGS